MIIRTQEGTSGIYLPPEIFDIFDIFGIFASERGTAVFLAAPRSAGSA